MWNISRKRHTIIFIVIVSVRNCLLRVFSREANGTYFEYIYSPITVLVKKGMKVENCANVFEITVVYNENMRGKNAHFKILKVAVNGNDRCNL